MTEIHLNGDIIAIPAAYGDEFRRDPVDALLKYGSLPQRARSPYFTDVKAIDEALRLPDMVTGARAVKLDPKVDGLSLEAGADEIGMLSGISPHFYAPDNSMWHVHVDLSLHKNRHGDAAGIAMGREAHSYIERAKDPLMQSYERVVRTYEIPLVAQIVAPVGSQIFISSIVRFILLLKQVRRFNITSFSFDQFQSADAAQQLMLAGLVTSGMHIDPDTQEVRGVPKPFSVNGRAVMPYRELLEATNERRVALPKYAPLRKQLRELEMVGPGRAPDHPKGGSNDVTDAVAGVVGYLAAFGHQALIDARDAPVYTVDEVVPDYEPGERFGPEAEDESLLDLEVDVLSFGPEK